MALIKLRTNRLHRSGFITVSAPESIKQSLHLVVPAPLVPELLAWHREFDPGVRACPAKPGPGSWLDLRAQLADPPEV